MGKQFSIAQSKSDEAQMVQDVFSKFNVLFVPRLFKRGEFHPQTAVHFGELKILIILKDSLDEVSKRVCDSGKNPDYQSIYPFSGICIEWSRTEIVNSSYQQGRFYLDTDDKESAWQQSLDKLFGALRRYVMKNYTVIEKESIFVGPNLSELLKKKDAKLVYANGTQILFPA